MTEFVFFSKFHTENDVRVIIPIRSTPNTSSARRHHTRLHCDRSRLVYVNEKQVICARGSRTAAHER